MLYPLGTREKLIKMKKYSSYYLGHLSRDSHFWRSNLTFLPLNDYQTIFCIGLHFESPLFGFGLISEALKQIWHWKISQIKNWGFASLFSGKFQPCPFTLKKGLSEPFWCQEHENSYGKGIFIKGSTFRLCQKSPVILNFKVTDNFAFFGKSTSWPSRVHLYSCFWRQKKTFELNLKFNRQSRNSRESHRVDSQLFWKTFINQFSAI